MIPPRKPPRRPRSLTPSMAANRIVNAQIQPVVAQQQADAARQNSAIQGFAMALLGKLQPIAGQVGQQYDQAIGQTAALSGAAANALREANPNQQDQQMLAAINAPAEQRAQVADKLANTFGGGAAVGLFNQGTVPGSMLAASKAAAQGQAAQLPGIAALKGQQDLAGAMYDQRQERNKLLAQRPALYQSALQNITSNNFERTKLAQAAGQQQFERDLAQATLGERIGHDRATERQAAANTAVRQQTAAQTQANKDRDWQLGYARVYGIDPTSGKPTLAAKKQAAATAAAAAKSAAKVKGIPAASYAKLKQQAGKAADTFYYGTPPVTRADGSTAKPGVSGIDYQSALRKLMNQYSLTLEDAQKILDGYYKPGEDGRPWLTLQQRQSLAKKGVPQAWIDQAMWSKQKANDLLKGLV